jgi:hypothetical protein
MDSGINGYNLVSLNTDAIAEFKLLTNAQQAEFGRVGGGAVALVTKSGTREFHGVGYIFHRHEDLNANRFTNNAQNILRPRYRFNTPGFTFGGPVVLPKTHDFKDKVFSFVAMDMTRQLRLGSQYNQTLPTARFPDGCGGDGGDGLGRLTAAQKPVCPTNQTNRAGNGQTVANG